MGTWMSQWGALKHLICSVSTGGLRRTMSETKGLAMSTSGTGKSCPPPLQFTSAPSASPGEPVTPTSKLGRRSFWDMLVTLLRDWWGAGPAGPRGVLGQEGEKGGIWLG